MYMICPWCQEEGKPGPTVYSFAEAEAHLRNHGATEEQIEQAQKAWQAEMRNWESLRRQEMEAIR